jgi:hypothetical protein
MQFDLRSAEGFGEARVRVRLATKLYYYTAREQTSEATKKCADCESATLFK